MAVDPLDSTSTILKPDIVGEEHFQVGGDRQIDWVMLRARSPALNGGKACHCFRGPEGDVNTQSTS